MKRPISGKIPSMHNVIRTAIESSLIDTRVASPGIIRSFDAITQTVTVELALREKFTDEDLNVSNISIPVLEDVPIVIPRAGGFMMTLPINAGDECLVVFSDNCIDAWFSNSGVQNQIELRRHDLSDAFAIIGTWSQPNRISNYSQESMEIRNESGSNKIVVSEGEINLVGSIKVNGVLI